MLSDALRSQIDSLGRYGDHPPLAQAVDLAHDLREAWDEAAYAASSAVGVALDDDENTNVAVFVHDGQIVYIGISDGALTRPLDQLQDILNRCIFDAFSSWRNQRRQPISVQ